jgi:hypothetical protein
VFILNVNSELSPSPEIRMMSMRFIFQFLLATAVATAGTLFAGDQTDAERTKQPVAVAILVAGAATADDPVIGNVQVTYADGTKDLWTTKGNCSLAGVAPDGIVGWTVNGSEIRVNSADMMRTNGTLILCRKGKVLASTRSGRAFIEKWAFNANGSQLVLVTRGSHGPADIELHDTATGRLIQSIRAYAGNLPEWARPYAE